jgi:hypothetical protein
MQPQTVYDGSTATIPDRIPARACVECAWSVGGCGKLFAEVYCDRPGNPRTPIPIQAMVKCCHDYTRRGSRV